MGRRKGKRQEEYDRYVESIADLKERIRERDGNKCRDCGMTREQHKEEHDENLHVHRTIPGAEYQEETCVTLCRECHNTKPRRINDVFESDDVKFFFYVMYQPRDKRLWELLNDESGRLGVSTADLMDKILLDHLEDNASVEKLDHCYDINLNE